MLCLADAAERPAAVSAAAVIAAAGVAAVGREGDAVRGRCTSRPVHDV